MKQLHIEQRNGELFLGNAVQEEFKSVYKTLRFGYRAYDKNNNLIPGLVPVFVKEQEVLSMYGQKFIDEHFLVRLN